MPTHRAVYENLQAYVGQDALDIAGVPGPDVRVVCCPRCDGDGGWEAAPHTYNPIDGGPISDWIVCGSCKGDCEIEIAADARTEGDLDAEADERGER